MAMKMDQGGLMQHQMPMHTDYGMPLASDCADHCGNGVHHDAYGNGAAMETMRRDSAMIPHIPTTFSYAAAQASGSAQFVTDRGVGEAQSGSISTSPSSAASSLAYTSYPGAHYTNVQHLPGPVQLPQSFVPSTFAEARSSSILDTPIHMLPPPQRHITSLPQPDNFSASSTPYLNRTQLSTPAYPAYSSYPYAETPRSVLSGTAQLSLSPGTSPYSNAHMANVGAQGYGTTASECAGFPWDDIENVHDLRCEGQSLTPRIIAKVEKGFFYADNDKRWTCYRRNYFSVSCSFELHPNVANGRLEIHRGNSVDQVHATGMRLSAAVDGPEGKGIELIQHTPKRDLGPKNKIDVTKIAPTFTGRVDQTMAASNAFQVTMGLPPSSQAAGPYLPLQATTDLDPDAGTSQTSQASATYPYASPSQPAMTSGPTTMHTFERVQFKQATANNGKRRATQQFFHLIVELFADIRKEGSKLPVWIKVAQRVSGKVVVRGRSPSHYSNDKNDPNSVAGRALQNGGSGGYSSMGGTSYASLNAGGFRTMPTTYNAANGYSVRRDVHSEHGSQSESSSSSLEENAIDANYANDALMSDNERIALHEHDGYQYYPSAMYEHVPGNTSLPPLAKLHNDGNFLGDKMYAVKAEYGDAIAGAQYQATGCNRFQGVDSSRGYFPDL